ncbi:MAG: ddl [Bacilli bacterium]|nr:ddl [Bacilli bacterium]
MRNEKIRVGVIFGGKSGEHEVSLLSAQSVMDNLDPEIYEIVPIGITKEGRWIPGAAAFAALGVQAPKGYLGTQVTINPSPTSASAAATTDSAFPMVPSIGQQTLDVLIPVLHGPFGEDGTVQGLLELMDVPYVGAGVLASSVAMDKIMMKAIFAQAGIEQCKYCAYTRRQWESSQNRILDEIESSLGYPCFIKPANLGSSVGISKANNRNELIVAINTAGEYDRRIIVEEGINAREIEVAVLGNDNPRASVPGEVIPGADFYDYNDKYMDGKTQYDIPAKLSDELIARIQQQAIAAYQAVDGAGLARVDFFLEKETHRILINEINTFPGFTRYSMYPKLWEATGLSYSELLAQLIRLALERHADKHRKF